MKHGLVFILFLGILSVPSRAQNSTPAKPPSPLEQTLISAEKSFMAALKKGDAEYVRRTLASDYSSVESDGQLHDRQEAVGELSSGGVDLSPYNMKVIELADNAAIVTYDVILHIPPSEDQGPPPRYLHWSSVWTKQDGQWKLKFQQSTPTHWGDW